MEPATTTWRSSPWARWLGWTVLFGLALAGATAMFFVYGGPYPALFWGLLAGLAGLAFLVGVRLRTQWWAIGPLVAYGLPAAAYMLYVSYQRSSLPTDRPDPQGMTWDWVVMLAIAEFVVAPCFLAALAGAWWGRRRRSAAPGPERVRSSGDASPSQRP